MSQTLRLTLELAGILLGLLQVFLAIRLARRLRHMDVPALSTQLFLHAAAARRFVVLFSLATLVFVMMPVMQFGDAISGNERFEVFHDASHILFILFVVAGIVGLQRMGAKSVKRP